MCGVWILLHCRVGAGCLIVNFIAPVVFLSFIPFFFLHMYPCGCGNTWLYRCVLKRPPASPHCALIGKSLWYWQASLLMKRTKLHVHQHPPQSFGFFYCGNNHFFHNFCFSSAQRSRSLDAEADQAKIKPLIGGIFDIFRYQENYKI